MPAQKFGAIIVPGILTVHSTHQKIPNFPLTQAFISHNQLPLAALEAPIQISYIVGKIRGTAPSLSGKSFRLSPDGLLLQETPLSRMGRFSVALDYRVATSSLFVNTLYHYLGRITIGNLHSVGWLLRDLSNFQLLHNGFCLLHAAGLRHEREVTLLIGLSNTGKTTTVIDLVKSFNAYYYGDDLVVTDGENLYPCPYTAANLNPRNDVSLRYRTIQWARRNIPLFENFGPKIPVTISDYLGDGNCAVPARITNVLFLRRSTQHRERELQKREAARLLLASNRTEFTYAASPIFNAAEYLGLDCPVTTLVDREAEICAKVVENAYCRLIEGGPEQFRLAAVDSLGIST